MGEIKKGSKMAFFISVPLRVCQCSSKSETVEVTVRSRSSFMTHVTAISCRKQKNFLLRETIFRVLLTSRYLDYRGKKFSLK